MLGDGVSGFRLLTVAELIPVYPSTPSCNTFVTVAGAAEAVDGKDTTTHDDNNRVTQRMNEIDCRNNLCLGLVCILYSSCLR